MEEKRCYLSGDDSVALNNAPLIVKRDAFDVRFPPNRAIHRAGVDVAIAERLGQRA